VAASSEGDARADCSPLCRHYLPSCIRENTGQDSAHTLARHPSRPRLLRPPRSLANAAPTRHKAVPSKSQRSPSGNLPDRLLSKKARGKARLLDGSCSAASVHAHSYCHSQRLLRLAGEAQHPAPKSSRRGGCSAHVSGPTAVLREGFRGRPPSRPRSFWDERSSRISCRGESFPGEQKDDAPEKSWGRRKVEEQ
jgi:hypothetical protein